MIDKILRTLDELGMNQGQLESLAGLPPSRISRWKAGTGEPTASQAGRIARVLKVPVEYLVYDDIDIAQEDHSDELAKILWLAAEIGHETAIQRLTMAPSVRSSVPTVAERKKEKPPRDGRSSGGRKQGA